jgi:GH25 family lysozyme M1 (1,4-beta-N-acetylmuramidase)
MDHKLRREIALAVLPELLRQFGSIRSMAVKIAFETADEFLRQEEEYRLAQPPVVRVRPPSKAPDNPRPNFYEDK